MGIRGKIIFNYLIIVLLVLLILEGAFLVLVNRYYVYGAQQYLLNKGSLATEFYKSKKMLSASKEDDLNYIIENIMVKDDKTNVQILDTKNHIIYDNDGFASNQEVDFLEYKEALKSMEMEIFKGKNELTDENIMALSIPLVKNDEINFVLRYSVSTKKLYNLIYKVYFISISLGLVVLLLSLILSLILANSIVVPIMELKKSAQQMAKKDFSKEARKYNDDEIGELADAFNHMSKEIKKADKLKNDFISSISHELRTPLTSVKGWAETLFYGNYKDVDSLNRGLEIIINEINRFITLVNELLDFSRFELNRIKIEPKKVDIKQLMIQVASQFRYRFQDEMIDLDLDIPGNKDFYVFGDENRLKQILINVVDNSIKYMDKKKTYKFIGLKMYKKKNKIYMEIEDNGIGMKKEDLKKAKDKFFRVDNQLPGSGLGLSITTEIIKLHKGELLMESKFEKGTKITIILNQLKETIEDRLNQRMKDELNANKKKNELNENKKEE